MHSVLLSRFGKDYTLFGESDFLTALPRHNPNDYYELNGDHTRATIIHKILPETRTFRTVATFREPLSRVASLYSYTCDILGATSSLEAFDDWVRLVFCNRYNGIWRAHGLQTDVIFNDYGLPCVDRIYTVERIADLLDFIVPGSGADAPRINQSSALYLVSDLRPTTQRVLLDFIARDLEFWETLELCDGMIQTVNL